MMWIYVVLSVVILIAIFYLFRKDKDILSGTDPTVSLQKVEITLERQDDDDNIENYTLNEDVDMLIKLSWTNGVGWGDRYNMIRMKLYFGETVVAERLIVRNDDPAYFTKFAELSMSFGTGSEIGEAERFNDSVTLDNTIIGKSLYVSMTVTDDRSKTIEVFRENDDTNGKRRLIDQTTPPKPIMITEEQIKRVVEITGLQTLSFPLNISELTSEVTFGKVQYMKIVVNDSQNFFIKPTSRPGEFIYYKDPNPPGEFRYIPGILKFYAPILVTLPKHVVVSYTSQRTGREYLMYDGKFIAEDKFKSMTFTSDHKTDHLVDIVESNKMSEILTEANYNYLLNNLLQNIDENLFTKIEQKPYFWSNGKEIVSPNGKYSLILHNDRDESDDGGVLGFKDKTKNTTAEIRIMQPDGNYIDYSDTTLFKWNDGVAWVFDTQLNKGYGIYMETDVNIARKLFLAIDNGGHLTVRHEDTPNKIITTIYPSSGLKFKGNQASLVNYK